MTATCPICGHWFADEKAVHAHLLHTKKHRKVAEEIEHLKFLLAEAERDKELLRQQRDYFRKRLQAFP